MFKRSITVPSVEKINATEMMCDLCLASIKSKFCRPVITRLTKRQVAVSPEDIFTIPNEWKIPITKKLNRHVKTKGGKPGDQKMAPLFVTIKRNNRVRGCVGTMPSIPLSDGLWKYAQRAAFGDTRYRPIEDMLGLNIEVALLHSFNIEDGPLEYDLGEDGLCISLEWEGATYNSMYLPHVPLKRGFTKKQTIVELIRKALGKNFDKLKRAFCIDKFTEDNFEMTMSAISPTLITFSSSTYNKNYNILGVVPLEMDGQIKKVNGLCVQRVKYSINSSLHLRLWEYKKSDFVNPEQHSPMNVEPYEGLEKEDYKFTDPSKVGIITFKGYTLTCDGIAHVHVINDTPRDIISFQVSIEYQKRGSNGSKSKVSCDRKRKDTGDSKKKDAGGSKSKVSGDRKKKDTGDSKKKVNSGSKKKDAGGSKKKDVGRSKKKGKHQKTNP